MAEQRETLDTDGNIDDQIVNDDVQIVEMVNRFFPNAVNGLKISGLHRAVVLADNISHSISELY